MLSIGYLVEPKVRLTEVIDAIEAKFPVRREPQRLVRKTVLDTFDWRLFTNDSSLCVVGNDGGATLRFETPDHVLDCPLPNGEMPAFKEDIPTGRVQKLVGSTIDVRRLLPRVELELKVQTICLLNEDEKTVARLHVHRGSATKSDNEGVRKTLPVTLHLAPIKGYEKSQRIAANIIEHEIGLRPTEESQFCTALRAVDAEPGNYVAKRIINLEPTMRADQAVMAICQELLQTMRDNEDGLRRDLDSEFLHDFRVAVRRTRSALRLLKGVLPAEARAHFKGEFKWLGSITGPVRDLDVYLLKIPVYRAGLPESMGRDLDPLDDYLHQHHRSEQRRLVKRLKSKRYQELKRTWEEFLSLEPCDDDPSCPNAARPVVDVASERIWKAYRRVHRDGHKITPDTPAKALHELRIDCKMLRYLLEFFRSLYPEKEVTKLINALKQLQDNLGDFNDLQVQQASLSRSAQEMSDEDLASVECLLAIGRLVEHLAQRKVEERERFSHCWKKFATSGNRDRFRRLFKKRSTATQ